MNEKIEKKGLLDRMLDSIERAGNRLPDPITMFLGLAIIVAVISAICSAAGINAVNPADGSTIEIFNLLSFDGIRYLWTNVITNFAGFSPLGMVLVAVIYRTASSGSYPVYVHWTSSTSWYVHCIRSSCRRLLCKRSVRPF